MNSVSAVIVVKDNPPYLSETLSSIKGFVDEIVIGDIGMDDRLRTKLENMSSVRIVPFKKAVPYVELIREELKAKAKGEWILLLDPDESITPALIDLVGQNMTSYDFFTIPRKNLIFGKWMQHSRWWPDYQVRMFRKDSVTWPRKIHQQPVTNGNGLTLRQDEAIAIVHHNYDSIDQYLSKAVRYAKAEASEIVDREEHYTLRDAIARGLSEFFSRYFAGQGFRDGMHGFVLAFMQMMYSFLVYFYYWELMKYPEIPESELIDASRMFFHQGTIESNHWTTVSGKGGIKQRIENAVMKKLR